MRKNRENEKRREAEARKIRDVEMRVMSEHLPDASAREAFERPAYQSISVAEYLKKINEN